MFSGEGIGEATAWVLDNQPAKAFRPDAVTQATWASTLLLIGFSGAVYPQAIQRIFAARSGASLRKALSVLAFLPFLTTLPVFLVGILALPRLSGLSGSPPTRCCRRCCAAGRPSPSGCSGCPS